MKIMMLLGVGILLVNSPVFAALSVADIEKIESIVKGSEARVKEYVSQEITKVNTRIDEMDKRLTIKIDEMDKRLTSQINAVDTQVGRNFNLVLGLIALIAVAIGLPQIITAWQGRKLREHTEKYEALRQEIEMLKQERTVRS